jgi:PAS domain S-box-containing protein
VNASSPTRRLLDSLALLHASEHLGVLTATVARITDANDLFLKRVGYTREEMEAGLIDWRAMTPPEYASLDERGLEELRQFGACVPFEKELVLRNGTRLPILIGAVRLRSEPLEWACWVIDLSSQKAAAEAERQSRELKLELESEMRGALRIFEISARLLSKHSLGELFSEILEAAIEVTNAAFGTLQILDNGVLRIVAHRAMSQEFVEFFREVSHSTTAACSAALRGNQRVIVEDVESSPLFEGTVAREVLLNAGIRAVQSTPLLGSSGEVLGVLSTHFRTCHRPPDRALRYLDLLDGRAAVLVESLRNVETERRLEKLTAVNEMANALAHEINNPVQALTNILDLLSRHQKVDGDAHDLVELGREQISRIAENVKKMLAMEFKPGAESSAMRKAVEHLRDVPTGGGADKEAS